MNDLTQAFVENEQFTLSGNPDGPLAGMTFVAKDLFDVAGHPTGGGNPDWQSYNPTPSKHAWAVTQLLEAGATLIGKTITDEVSLGILGENAFYGTPINPRAPGHVPGGSSSGTASAVASGHADTGLGTDTGGSVRVPASFCGLYGIRPTHGRLNLSGMLPQAPSSDTTGWFARDAETFTKVSAVMLEEDIPDQIDDPHFIIASDAFGFAEPETSSTLRQFIDTLNLPTASLRDEILAPQGLSVWGRAQRTLQPAEAWETFKDWLDECNPRLAFNVARGLILGASITDPEKQWAALMRQEARARLRYLLPSGTFLLMPTTPFPAPKKNLPLVMQNQLREQILCLCAHGGLAGLPQINIPGAEVEGRPVGLSVIAGPGQDAMLVALARQWSNL